MDWLVVPDGLCASLWLVVPPGCMPAYRLYARGLCGTMHNRHSFRCLQTCRPFENPVSAQSALGRLCKRVLAVTTQPCPGVGLAAAGRRLCMPAMHSMLSQSFRCFRQVGSSSPGCCYSGKVLLPSLSGRQQLHTMSTHTQGAQPSIVECCGRGSQTLAAAQPAAGSVLCLQAHGAHMPHTPSMVVVPAAPAAPCGVSGGCRQRLASAATL